MKYNFDKPVNRFGTNCYKHDEMPNSDTIALWVADMDFETAPIVQQAVMKRMEHGCFGYTMVPESFYDATINWFEQRYHWNIQREWFIYTSGVVPAVSAIIKALKNYIEGETPEDLVKEANINTKVLIHSPAYNCFFSSIRNNNCEIVENPLIYNKEDGSYSIDWINFEEQCEDPDVWTFILCNPHNPTGRVWTKDELIRMGEICKRNDVFIIVDEIHCEFVNHTDTNSQTARTFTPFASVSDAPCAVCLSPSKAFNIAGMQIANIIAPNPLIRARIDKAININEVCDVNPFGVIALQAAYTPEGAEWLGQLNDYIYGNYAFAKAYIEANLPLMKVTPLEGTYLMWVNISAYGMPSDQFAQYLLDNANVCVNAGMMYGDDTGRDFIRINLATQRARLSEALSRIKETLNNNVNK